MRVASGGSAVERRAEGGKFETNSSNRDLNGFGYGYDKWKSRVSDKGSASSMQKRRLVPMDRWNRCQAAWTPRGCALYLRNSDWFRLHLHYYAVEEIGNLQV